MKSEESPSPVAGGGTPASPSTTPDRREEYKRRGDRQRMSFAVPTSKEEDACVKERHVTDENPNPWQYRLLKVLNSPTVQHIIIVMLLLDVFIIFIELAIDAFYPSCDLIERDAVSCCTSDEVVDSHDGAGEVHRFMAGINRLLAEKGDGHYSDLCTAPLVETSDSAGCDDHKYPGVHIAHEVLFSFTLIILILFEIELLLMMYLLGPKKYFSRLLYALDLLVVTVSLILEIIFRVVHEDILNDLVGILILFRVWRFVRIGHGLVATTFELQEERMHELKHYVHELEEMVETCGGELPKKKPSVLAETESEQ
eukprot:CAMPEP_0201688496 /NCGR_PEP_ID=MMETSP0578-20130828/2244_1 /ASSEMBLY_ACC=CAM_ASM_000663 /TAXON_ID=267565 /ORGANISM="Skeletonema grethea, Strain CCMP 1804" /LENGTH=311 /DNA_ID=CAMNT_0048172833 /DNA_START=13 /DNA_END=948 /DNA_ORIENTATION=-